MGKLNLNQILQNLKPLNFEKRLLFQTFCEYLVENEQIEQAYVEQYTTEEFLYGGHKKEYENYKIEIFEYNEMIDEEKVGENKTIEKYLDELKERHLIFMTEEFEEEIREDEEERREFGRKKEILFQFLRNLPRNIIATYCVYKLVKMFI